jgi:hypothetical protein
MRAFVFGAAILAALPAAADEAAVTLAPYEKDRRWLLMETPVSDRVGVPCEVADEQGRPLPSQAEGKVVRWLVPFVPAGARPRFVIRPGASKLPSMALVDLEGGIVSVRAPDREITRFYPAAGTTHRKPCFYPLVARGANVLRGFPIEDRPGEARDHPHHSGIYHAFGDVNGRDYWAKVPITHRRILAREAGPACARLVVENAWGEDLVEIQDVRILNAGEDAVLDWTITLRAGAAPVVLGASAKMAKEGSFAVRVGAELSRKGDAPDLMTDALGNRGEKAIRQAAAPWVDYSAEVNGKRIGVAVLNHPSSFRYPTTWHVRAYGLFAANPWYVAEAKGLDRKGEQTLGPGESVVLKYRVYVHGGDAAEGKVADVFAGYAHAEPARE